MRLQLLTGLLVAGLSVAAVGADNDQALRRAVVKVFATQGQLNLNTPWHRSEGREVTGSGVWLGNRRILTNAHCVERNIQVSVQTHDSSDRIPASVKFIAHAMDLAVLEVETDEPFQNAQPAELVNELPKLRTTVRVYGFPEGGNSLSVTEGIVSRIEYTAYHLGELGLRMQVDAAVNRGNSGGPVVSDGKLVGLAFAKVSLADNIGYAIPAEEIAAVLQDGEDGAVDGKLQLGVEAQRLENPALRKQLGVPKEVLGVLVNSISSRVENFPLRVGDVITQIGGQALDNSGQGSINDEIKVPAAYFSNKFARDARVSVTVWRNDTTETLEVPLERTAPNVQQALKGRDPDWFLMGPFVFGEATADFFQMFDAILMSGNAPQRPASVAALLTMQFRNSPLLKRRYERPAFDGEQLVVVLNWLPHRIGTGYSAPTLYTLKSLNGQKVQNTRHLVELLRDSREEYWQFDFYDEHSERIVLTRQETLAATKNLMDKLAIPRQGSPNLLDIWNAKPAE